MKQIKILTKFKVGVDFKLRTIQVGGKRVNINKLILINKLKLKLL